MQGILAIEPLYHQIIKGKKTQTRRSGGLQLINDEFTEGWAPTEWVIEKLKSGKQSSVLEFMIPGYRGKVIQCAPRYKVGEVLYLKEPLIIMGGDPVYKYDLEVSDAARTYVKFKNKLFMPQKYARVFIKITGIKCERLLDISEEDCVAEGIELFKHTGWKNYDIKKKPKIHSYGSPKNSFISLFRFANKIKPTAETPNIWVWVYTFENFKPLIK